MYEVLKCMETEYEEIRKAVKFKYLEKVNQPNADDKGANLVIARKI